MTTEPVDTWARCRRVCVPLSDSCRLRPPGRASGRRQPRAPPLRSCLGYQPAHDSVATTASASKPTTTPATKRARCRAATRREHRGRPMWEAPERRRKWGKEPELTSGDVGGGCPPTSPALPPQRLKERTKFALIDNFG